MTTVTARLALGRSVDPGWFTDITDAGFETSRTDAGEVVVAFDAALTDAQSLAVFLRMTSATDAEEVDRAAAADWLDLPLPTLADDREHLTRMTRIVLGLSRTEGV